MVLAYRIAFSLEYFDCDEFCRNSVFAELQVVLERGELASLNRRHRAPFRGALWHSLLIGWESRPKIWFECPLRTVLIGADARVATCPTEPRKVGHVCPIP